ncbi:MAG: tetratricopeptide repeat protein, partial [Pseudomonadota bacterium]
MNFEEFETYVPDKVDFRPALKAQVRRYGRNTPAARDNAARGPDGFVLWSAKGAIGFIRKLPNFPRDRDDQRDDPIGYYKGIVEDWSRSDKSRRGSRRLALAVLYWFFKEVSEPSYFKEIARHVWGHRTETFKRFIYAKCGGESDDSFKEISERFHAEIGVVEEAFPRFWIEEKPPFSLELPAKSTQIHHYTSSPIEILGREGEQEALERFRDSGPGFFWWQIAGVAGQGKSRLALDLVLKTREELPDWETGFLVDEDSVKSFAEECESWTPTRPYLILVDYVVGVAEFLRLAIQALAKRRQAFDVPVKLLIIERQPWRQAEGADRISLASTASWYAQLTVRRNGDDALLEEARYREDEEEFPNLIELKALEAHHLIDIVTQIAKRGDRPAVIDGEQIEKLLERIDGKGRPLFAYFLGRALGVGRIDVTEQAADLLDWVLDTDWRTRWKAQFGNDDEPPRVGDDPLPIKGSSESNPSMRLALLATMVRKIDCDAFEALQGWSKASTKIRRQALVICDRPIPLGPPPRVIEGLEPDILGSWFVLRSIRFGINAEWLTATAWQLDPKRMSEFLVRITQDFPAHPATLRLLATWPSGRHAKDAYAGVASALIRCFSQADRREPTPGYLDAKTAIARGIRRAAAMKSSDGMADYGVCLNQGYGFAKRAELGVRWLKYAADAGHSGAMASLGVCYERGDGVAQDMAAALDWYRKGAAAGHGGAMANLGLCYARGDGVEADMATALEWYRKGAAAGDGGAMACLGLCYELGDGVEADMATALEWYRKGAAAG